VFKNQIEGGYIRYRGVNTPIINLKLLEKCTPVVIATGSADYPMRAHNIHTSIRKYDAQMHNAFKL